MMHMDVHSADGYCTAITIPNSIPYTNAIAIAIAIANAIAIAIAIVIAIAIAIAVAITFLQVLIAQIVFVAPLRIWSNGDIYTRIYRAGKFNML